MLIGELKGKINRMIEAQLKANGAVSLAWVVNALIGQCDFAEDERIEQPMRVLAAREGFRSIVGAVNRDRKDKEGEDEPEDTPLFPGFERLQLAYSIERQREEWIVEIERMSVPELKAKREQLVRMRTGLTLHIEEIDRYIARRQAS
jgi:hypothetical protein